MTIKFYKYQGAGNDFVMINNLDRSFPKANNKLIEKLCDRRFGIGGDGLILLESDNDYDFRMVYFNADGFEGTMCGNGGRCCVAFAKQMGIIENFTKFIAIDGEHEADFEGELVNLKMMDVNFIAQNTDHYFLDTGSPHHVEFTKELSQVNVQQKGSEIRNGAPYFEEGTNVNFAENLGNNTIKVRTFERGVEGETLACGTGVTAVALSAYKEGILDKNIVKIKAEGGDLEVSFNPTDEGFENIYLKGPATFVYSGNIEI
ncbi:MAG: diaminopimelate epimerase [Flavobacteriales bacterium]|nr:diaminopimelate epimerase [Flavobacteriales bacterium]